MTINRFGRHRLALRRPGRLARGALPVAAVAVAAVLLAGCGGSGSPGVASLGRSTPTPSPSAGSSGSQQQDAVAFAQCMRQHGITHFPDPGARGDLFINSATGIDPNSPQFQAAQSACRSLLPNGGQPDPQQQQQFQQAALAFSRCMRAHGIADFPDPQFQSGGGFAVQLPSAASRNSPQFQAAQQACQSLLPRPNGPGQATSGGPQGGGGTAGGGAK